MRILYVEDNPRDTDLVRRALARSEPQPQLDIVTTLAEARDALRATEPRHDVLLTDLNLPDGHGIDLVVELRAQALPLAVVALTGQGDEALVMSALKAGADDYLAKADGFEARVAGTLNAALARFQADRERHVRALRVLYAEHNPLDIDLTRRHFERHAANIQLDGVHDAAAVMARLQQPAGEDGPCDVLLLDYRLAGDTGLDVLKWLRQDRGLDLPVVMVTGQGSEDVAAQAMRLGATDYVVKRDHYLMSLPATLENAYHRVRAARDHAALRRSEERLALMLRGSSDAPWDLDLLRGERYVSPRLWQMLGRAQIDTTPDPVLAQGLLHPDEQAALAQQLRAALEGHGDTFEAELRLRHQAGHFVPLLARGYILRDAQGRALRLSGTCVDLTERHRAEAEVRELNASLERRVAERTLALEQANHELEAFSYSVSHDLRAPLRAVDGLAALLQQDHDAALNDQGRERLRLLRASATRMAGLIHDLLEFARTARQTPRRTQVPVAALVRHCLEEFRGEIDARAVAVEIGALPDCSADPTLLRQVFVNLLGNAVKYTRRQPQARIEVGTETQQGQVVYVVHDNGTGFDMRHAKKLFGVFQRLHADVEFEGSGVGLAIVDRIVQRHGGRVWAQAAPGEGATFYFTLGPPAAP
ncbi:MAG: hypothetical protein A3E25_00410 [Burkholderiales bacterium RIFCSPHIGHO2_12_FULL_69_20]|nr:MAG: hypothetical protein A3E25_00410 [Burkholderiales bacterium RIFCSPHIGHO2_12_FULL_69_20]